MHKNPLPPVLGFAAYQGVGKTHLLLQLLPLLCERGICVGIIKHTHQNFDVDKPGTDSYLLRKAGAQQTLVTSNQRWALMVEREYEHEPRINEHLAHFEHETLDLILVEGFTNGSFPKIELHRPALGRPLLFPGDPTIIAVASDSPLILPDEIKQLDLNQLNVLAEYICQKSLNSGHSLSDEKNKIPD